MGSEDHSSLRGTKMLSPGAVGLEENKSKHVSGSKVYRLWAFSTPRAHSTTTELWKGPRFAEMLVSTQSVEFQSPGSGPTLINWFEIKFHLQG